jgi:hypothetical protein
MAIRRRRKPSGFLSNRARSRFLLELCCCAATAHQHGRRRFRSPGCRAPAARHSALPHRWRSRPRPKVDSSRKRCFTGPSRRRNSRLPLTRILRFKPRRRAQARLPPSDNLGALWLKVCGRVWLRSCRWAIIQSHSSAAASPRMSRRNRGARDSSHSISSAESSRKSPVGRWTQRRRLPRAGDLGGARLRLEHAAIDP